MVAVLALLFAAKNVRADPVGQRSRSTNERTAALRDAAHRNILRIMAWYPAAAGATEQEITFGPGAVPDFDIGEAAPNAPFAAGRFPVVLLSPGDAGSAEIMGWFGIGLAHSGYVVIAVDHPGDNATDPVTALGKRLWWNRVEDLATALDVMSRDRVAGPHLDTDRLGAAGFSVGGLAALVAAGARVDRAQLRLLCTDDPSDPTCPPSQNFAGGPSFLTLQTALGTVGIQAEIAHAGDDHAIPHVQAVFAMAPAPVQALDTQSLMDLHVPVAVMLGDADTVALPQTNGFLAAQLIPHATITVLPGVGHDDFLAACTDAGKLALPQCLTPVPQDQTHAQAVAAAVALFDGMLKPR